MKLFRKSFVVVVSLMIPALMSGCGAKGEKSVGASTTPKPVPVRLADVEIRAIERTVGAVGTLKGWDEVTVGAKKVGRVAKILHDIGDHVAPGEMLVEFETKDAELSLEQAKKQLLAELAKVGVILDKLPDVFPTDDEIKIYDLPTIVQAKVAVDRAQNNFIREKNLMSKGAGMRQELQNTENDVRSAEEAYKNAILTAKSIVVSARAAAVRVQMMNEAIKDMEVRAPRPTKPPVGLKSPLSYAVSKKSVSEGQMIREGDACFDLVIENPLRVWLNIPERYVSEVKVGQDVRITVASYPKQAFPATVTRINPMVDSSSRTFQVEATVPNDEGKLRPGGFAKAEIITERNAKAVIVPLDAIVRFAGVTKLFVVQGDDKKARSIAVETGKEGPGWAELLTPLPENSKVVTTGQSQLADDTPIVVTQAEVDPATPTKTSAETRSAAKKDQ
jgi:multidrug efflux pump subunit AcrA (membrane-fusion protein)